MTENELRQKVADIITGWEGAKRGSKKHLEILDIYNSHKPLARGYAVQVDDSWCAAAASAAWIEAGIAEWTGTECSCSRLIEIAKAKGWWIENDKYIPKIGDAVLYDWDDGANYASTDNKGAPEHIGIITNTGMGAFVVTEGNMGSASICGRRTLGVNGRYIRGFICPDYARIAAELTEREKTMTFGEFLASITDEQAYEIHRKAMNYMAKQEIPVDYNARHEYDAAVADGITDGSRPLAPASRLETAIMIERGIKKCSE